MVTKHAISVVLFAFSLQCLFAAISSISHDADDAVPADGTVQDHDTASSLAASSRSEARNPKFLSLFTRVEFANSVCGAGIGNSSVKGVCMTRNQCHALNGTISGQNCAREFGVCCIFQRSCGERTRQQVSYFTSPASMKSSAAETCLFSLDVPTGKFCQLRLDFEKFTLAQPTKENGYVCKDEYFYILGNFEPKVFDVNQKLCGEMSKQHVYLHMDPQNPPKSIVYHVNANPTTSNWRIRSTFIECSAKGYTLAPRPCLQYFTKPTGVIESFNYNGGKGHYLADTEYQICILRQFGIKRVNYQAVEFDLGDAQTDEKGQDCSNEVDWLTIPSRETPYRFCRGKAEPLSSALAVDLPTQYTMTFHSDSIANGNEAGFRIKYSQAT